jgi:hypothetical protein
MKPFDPRSGSEHFRHFWQKSLYPTDAVRSDLAPTIYKLVRHGLAHAFVTKPLILVTKNKGTKNHLCRDAAGVLTIDCLALADDFRTAYERFVIPQVRTAQGHSVLQRQLDLMHRRDTEDSDNHVISRVLAGRRPDGGATVHSVRAGNDQFTYGAPTPETVVSAAVGFTRDPFSTVAELTASRATATTTREVHLSHATSVPVDDRGGRPRGLGFVLNRVPYAEMAGTKPAILTPRLAGAYVRRFALSIRSA